MTKIYIVWASWDEHGPIVTKDCGIFTNKKIADDKLNQMKKEDEEHDEEIWSWVSEYELNDQGEYKVAKHFIEDIVEGETE